MSNENEMQQKYQQHYNKLLVGTLNDTLLKSISYQANVQLANDIIADQEKIIVELQKASEDVKKELETTKTNKTTSEKNMISVLESQIKSHTATISKLRTDLYDANKLRTAYENVKHQVQHIDTLRNDLIKAREEIKNLQVQHDKTVEDLKKHYEDKLAKFEKTPTKKKAAKVAVKKVAPIKTIEVEQFKDGGSF